MGETQVLDAPNVERPIDDAGFDDFVLSPTASNGNGGGNVEAKMSAVVYDRAHAEFVTPSGDLLYIFSKSEGQLRHIDIALQEWLDAERHGERKIVRIWRFWRWRRKRVFKALTDIQRAKYAFFCAVFADPYNVEKHQELTVAEFLKTPIDLQTAIMAAHREANDPTDLLAAILGREIVGDGKKKQTQRPGGLL